MSTSPEEELPETPDAYDGAAETDPDHWRDDPLIEDAEGGEPVKADPEHPVVPSEQELREETAEARYEAGDEQVPPDEPGMGEAQEELDVPEDPTFPDEVDSSNDSFHGGGDPTA